MDQFQFDERLITTADSTEKKEMILFQWMFGLEKDLPFAPKAAIEKLFIKYALGIDPRPGQALKNAFSRGLVLLYEYGETRTLFDTITLLQNSLSNKKIEDLAARISAVHILGSLTEVHGPKVASLFPETINVLSKIFKSVKEGEVALKYEVLAALCASVKGSGRFCSEQIVKDLVKISKAGISDKNINIQTKSIQLMGLVHSHSPMLLPAKVDEFDTLLSYLFKTLEVSTPQMRKAVAEVSSNILYLAVSPQSELKTIFKKHGKQASGVQVDADKTTTVLELKDALNVLSSQLSKNPSKEIRGAIFECYLYFLQHLGMTNIETNRAIIFEHLLCLCSNPKFTQNHNESLFIRSCVSYIIQQAGKMLSEGAQSTAVGELIDSYIRKYPAVLANEQEPHHLTLACVLTQIFNFLIDLGAAAGMLKEALFSSLSNLVNHPSEAVINALGSAIKAFCIVIPSVTTDYINKLLPMMQKDATLLSADQPEILHRFIGCSRILASVISSIAYNPLYIPYEYSARVLGFTLQLLKQAPQTKDFRVSCTQTEAAWILIAALMTIGPNFVRTHTSQLFLTWKNIFSKVGSADSITSKSDEEILQQIITKEAGLTAILSFLENNSEELVTPDVAKRFAVFLNNAGSFIAALPDNYSNPVISTKILDHELMLKKRLFQCCLLLNPKSALENTQTNLLSMAIDVFGSMFERTIAKFTMPGIEKEKGFVSNPSLDFPFVSSLVQGYSIQVSPYLKIEDKSIGKWADNTNIFEKLMVTSNLTSLDFDVIGLLRNGKDLKDKDRIGLPQTAPVIVDLINYSIELFATFYPLQNASYQELCMESLLKMAKSLKETKDLKISEQRKTFIFQNILTAVNGALKHSMAKQGSIQSGKVHVIIRDLVEDSIVSPNNVLRNLSGDIMGRLCQSVGTAGFVNTLIQNIVDQIVKNRDPESRSGNSLALGCIIGYMGGLASSHLKNIVGILHSLSSDPHPLVHTWALYSLALVVENASLMYGPYVNSTLGIISKLMVSDSHEICAPQVKNPNNCDNHEVYPCLGRLLYAILGVVGPELQTSPRIREFCFNIYEFLKQYPDPAVVIEAIKCVQHLFLFAPQYVPIQTVVPFLQIQIKNDKELKSLQMRKAAITCLYQLTQKNAEAVLGAVINNQLEEQLLAMMDTETDELVLEGIRDILIALLKHVGPIRPSRWISLCKSVLSKGTAVTGPPLEHEYVDDEAAGEDTVAQPQPRLERRSSKIYSKDHQFQIVLSPRWRTQVFVVNCVRQLLKIAKDSLVVPHFDLMNARSERTNNPQVDFLVFKLSELIAIAFNACTNEIKELNLEGLYLLQEVLMQYAASPDPDVEGHSILEQYQAQISAALTPAFNVDSHIEVKSLACQVASIYVTSGINKDIHALSRVMKCLSGALRHCRESEESTDKSQEAESQLFTKFKIGVLSAWANLFIYGETDKELQKSVIDTKLDFLADQWLSMLDLYCRLNLEPANKDMKVNLSMGHQRAAYLDGLLMATSDILLAYMKNNWITFLHALLLTLENGFTSLSEEKNKLASVLLIGLCMEDLSRRTCNDVHLTIVLLCKAARMFVHFHQSIDTEVILDVLRVLDHMSVSGDIQVRLKIVETIKELLPTLVSKNLVENEKVFDLLFGIVSNAFTIYIPGLAINPTSTVCSAEPLNPSITSLLGSASECLIQMVESGVFSSKTIGCCLLIITSILTSKKLSADVGSGILPHLQRLVAHLKDKKLIGSSVQTVAICAIEEAFVVSDEDSIDVPFARNLILSLVLFHKAGLLKEKEDVSCLQNVLKRGLDSTVPQLSLQCIQSTANTANVDFYVALVLGKIVSGSAALVAQATQVLSDALIPLLKDQSKFDAIWALALVLFKTSFASKGASAKALVSVVQSFPLEFKALLAQLTAEQKAEMEQVIKMGISANQTTNATNISKNQIQLKSFV